MTEAKRRMTLKELEANPLVAVVQSRFSIQIFTEIMNPLEHLPSLVSGLPEECQPGLGAKTDSWPALSSRLISIIFTVYQLHKAHSICIVC